MYIDDTNGAYSVSCSAADTGTELIDLIQQGNWIQIDKQQAAQLIEVLQKWVAGVEVE